MHPRNGSRGWLCAVSVLLIALRLAFSAPVHAPKAEPQGRAAGRKNLATTITQVWGSFCSRSNKCAAKAAPPERAYVISLPQDLAKRKHMEQSLSGLGLSVETVDAIPSDQLGDLREFAECKPATTAYDCQAGLTRSHIEAWNRLAKSREPAAWIFEHSDYVGPGKGGEPAIRVFEDDAVFHDDFLDLFPEYWSRVPHDFQFVYVGHIYWGSVWDNETVHVAPRTAPWGTHAYVIDAETAERLALLGAHMIDRARLHAARRASIWQLDGHDIKIDHFIKNYYDALLPQRQRSRWVVFESPVAEPWSFGGVTAAHSNACNCKCAAGAAACVREGKSPLIWANGLIAQHNCGNAIDQLGRWQEGIRQVPQSRLCHSKKDGQSEHLDAPQLPALLQVLRNKKGRTAGSSSRQQ